MRPSVEFLLHCRCDHCQLWWAQADLLLNLERIYCPHCGQENTIELPLKHGIDRLQPEQQRAMRKILGVLVGEIVKDPEGDRHD